MGSTLDAVRATQAEEHAVRAVAAPVQRIVLELLAAGARGPFEVRMHSTTLPKGFTGIIVNVDGHAVPLVVDPFVPPGEAYVIETADLDRFERVTPPEEDIDEFVADLSSWREDQ